jgi:hypothetical protein
MWAEAALAGNTASTLMMTGLIWLIQIVHYPLFDLVGSGQFPDYERRHARLISWVVGPLMLVELGCAAALVFFHRESLLAWAGLGLLAVIWFSTAFIQVPCHDVLQSGFNAAAHKRLVRSNWIRTIAWTLRGIIALLLIRPR